MDRALLRIVNMAKRNGFQCGAYIEKRRSYGCSRSAVGLLIYARVEKVVRIDLTQIGPRSETEEFVTMGKALSDFLDEEFQGQNIQVTNPMKR